MFDRLAQMLTWCAERGLYAQPSLLVGWMSGGVFWPRHFYPGNNPRQLSRWLVMANYVVRQLGYDTRVVRGDLPLRLEVKTIVIPGSMLDAIEVQALAAWVRDGGGLIWHGPDPVNWGHEYVRLLGARPVDYRAPCPATVKAFEETWTMGVYPRGMRAEVVPDGAAVLARDQEGLPMLLSHRAGRGQITYALPVIEASAAEIAGDRQARKRWLRWYTGMLTALNREQI